jgi:hypothetical protein
MVEEFSGKYPLICSVIEDTGTLIVKTGAAFSSYDGESPSKITNGCDHHLIKTWRQTCLGLESNPCRRPGGHSIKKLYNQLYIENLRTPVYLKTPALSCFDFVKYSLRIISAIIIFKTSLKP